MDEIERLLDLGRMDLEAGYPEYARQYFEKVLELDADNEIARQAIAEIDALLERRRASSESVGPEVALPKPAGEEEEMRETDLSEDEYSQPLPTDLTELLQFQCQQLVKIEVELQTQRKVMEKQTKHLRDINSAVTLVMLLIIVGVVLTMCSALGGY